MDPETTYSLPPRQVSNGIVDTFVHVAEQYLTAGVPTPLQDRQAEAILLTLIEEAPKVRSQPQDYTNRGNLMWCATQALNGLIGCGVTQDWSTHQIGHELTALYGIDHGQSLAVVLPAVCANRKSAKAVKLGEEFARACGESTTPTATCRSNGPLPERRNSSKRWAFPRDCLPTGSRRPRRPTRYRNACGRNAKIGEGESILPDQVRIILRESSHS